MSSATKISKSKKSSTPNPTPAPSKKKKHQASPSPQAQIDNQVMARAGSRMFQNVLQGLPAAAMKDSAVEKAQGKADWQQQVDPASLFKGGGSALPPGLMAKYEAQLGGQVSFDQVRLHQGSDVDQHLHQAGLQGLTDGVNVAISSQAEANTREHELGHVAQQQMPGFQLAEGNRGHYERDADQIAAKLSAGNPVKAFQGGERPNAESQPALQAKCDECAAEGKKKKLKGRSTLSGSVLQSKLTRDGESDLQIKSSNTPSEREETVYADEPEDAAVTNPDFEIVRAISQEHNLELAEYSLQGVVDAVQDEVTSIQTVLEDTLNIAQVNSDAGAYTGLEPTEVRDDPYYEEQRIWALNAIEENAEHICEVANYYGLTAHAIAGAILWEALENPYDDDWLVGRGTGLATFTRPGSSDDYGILGKIHTYPGSVSRTDAVQARVRQRRPDGVLTSAEPILGRTWQLENLLLNDQELTIEYIGAILHARMDLYEGIFEQYGDSIDIGDQAGVLAALYQGGLEDNPSRYNTIRERAADGNPYNNRPGLPENEAMGPWVSQYRWFIAELLEANGCLQGNDYLNSDDLPSRSITGAENT